VGPGDDLLRNICPDVFRENFINQRLIPEAPAPCFLTKVFEYSRIDANSNQLTRLITERRPSHPSHRLELFGRRLRDIREVNLSARTPHARGGSLVSH
jgi:hypothetical protein